MQLEIKGRTKIFKIYSRLVTVLQCKRPLPIKWPPRPPLQFQDFKKRFDLVHPQANNLEHLEKKIIKTKRDSFKTTIKFAKIRDKKFAIISPGLSFVSYVLKSPTTFCADNRDTSCMLLSPIAHGHLWFLHLI